MVSPNVNVTVNNQTIYSETAPTTIPLFVIATRENKVSSSGTGTAPGTAEADKLRVVTSQREVIQYYGNPVFVTSAGDPVHGDETNEYGLLALHSFMGAASRAMVIRADIDLGGLVPNSVEPVSPPPDNTYWVDKDAVSGGIFRYDGTNWNAVNFSVYTTSPTASDGADGDWAFDYSTADGTIMFKDGGTWYAASDANVKARFGASNQLWVRPNSTFQGGAISGDFWFKTTSSAGGVNMRLSRYRSVDNVFVTQAIIRQDVPPVPNQNTIWEDTSNIATSGARPIYVGTGETFIPLAFYVQDDQPVAQPEEGTLWYDDDISDFALYVEGTDLGYGNQWVPITTTTVSNPTARQKVISGSAPLMPNVGAYWVDISSPENIDNYPTIKQYNGSEWIDITDSVVITDDDPGASLAINGTVWLNLGESKTRNTVKRFNPDYTAYTVVENGGVYEVVEETGNFWQPAAGDTFGRKAQRELVVESMQAALVSNEEIRDESNYFQIISAPGYPELYNEMVNLNADNDEVSFIVADTPKFMRPNGIPTGREITAAEWITNANNAETTGEQGFTSGYTPYAGLWYPWCMTTNVDGNNVVSAPSHIALRTIAYNDSVAAPWYAPAGTRRGRVLNAESVGYFNNDGDYQTVKLIKAHRDILYENNINPIAFIPNTGLTVFGQKTLAASASAMDRVNVVRLIAKMKYDLRRLLDPFLFEINNPLTRSTAKVVVDRYLAGLKSLNAIYDYASRCDENNNTAAVIQANEMYVDVAIKPSIVIEFIHVPITVVNTGDDFEF